jgi:hypothetical protein
MLEILKAAIAARSNVFMVSNLWLSFGICRATSQTACPLGHLGRARQNSQGLPAEAGARGEMRQDTEPNRSSTRQGMQYLPSAAGLLRPHAARVRLAQFGHGTAVPLLSWTGVLAFVLAARGPSHLARCLHQMLIAVTDDNSRLVYQSDDISSPMVISIARQIIRWHGVPCEM